MLKNQPLLHVISWNVMIITLWHCVVFIICTRLPNSVLDASKPRYLAFRWERNGNWYRDKLHIQNWKDNVPQHIKKGGFSKKHLTQRSLDYLDQFILETCRGEWMHLSNCGCVVVVMFANPLTPGLIFSFLVLLGNLPFVCIQRYNRFRLQVLRKAVARELRLAQVKKDTVSVSS